MEHASASWLTSAENSQLRELQHPGLGPEIHLPNSCFRHNNVGSIGAPCPRSPLPRTADAFKALFQDTQGILVARWMALSTWPSVHLFPNLSPARAPGCPCNPPNKDGRLYAWLAHKVPARPPEARDAFTRHPAEPCRGFPPGAPEACSQRTRRRMQSLKRPTTGCRPRLPRPLPPKHGPEEVPEIVPEIVPEKIGATARTFRLSGRPLRPRKFGTGFLGPLFWARSGGMSERPGQPPTRGRALQVEAQKRAMYLHANTH